MIDAAFAHGYGSLSGFTQAYKNQTGVSPKAGSNVVHVYQLLTPLGPMLAGTVEGGICLLEFTDRRALETELAHLQKKLNATLLTSEGPHLADLRSQLREYFAGKRREFDIPLVTPGSDFQNKVWSILFPFKPGCDPFPMPLLMLHPKREGLTNFTAHPQITP